MNARHWILAAMIAILVPLFARAQAQREDDAKIKSLVRKLGSSAYIQREQARRELEAIGTPALDALRTASRGADVETKRRLDGLIAAMERRLVTEQVLAPKEIRLTVKDVTVQQAIAELARVSEYPIQFFGDATPFAEKKITLDTGKTSFWNAFDQLCQKAGLMEKVDLTAPAPSIGTQRIGRNGMRRIYPSAQQPVQAGPILVTNRGAEVSYTRIAGSIKTELRVSRDAATKEIVLTFLVSAEPRMINNGVVGRPILDKCIDAQGQRLPESAEPAKKDAPMNDFPGEIVDMGEFALPLKRFTQVRFKDDRQAAKAIKEIAGRLTYQLDTQNEMLARVPKIMDAAGKSISTGNGGTLKVLAVRKEAADIVVDVSMENTSPNPFGGNVIINGGGVVIRGNVIIRGGGIVIGPNGVRMNGGNGNHADLPHLVDSKGKKFAIVGVQNDSINFVNGLSTRTSTIHFRPNAEQAEPSELVLLGTRTHTLDLPFRFENISLP